MIHSLTCTCYTEIIEKTIKENSMVFRRNPVQSFIRNLVRLIIIIPLFLIFAYSDFRNYFDVVSSNLIFWGLLKTLIIVWIANIAAKMFFILPQWERLVLLRLGKSVGVRGPGMFIIPPFIYSVARILDDLPGNIPGGE